MQGYIESRHPCIKERRKSVTDESGKPSYNATSPQVSKTEAGNGKQSFRQWQLREGDVLYRLGVEQLSNTHLLAHLLRDHVLAERMMERFGSLTKIAEASITELKHIPGVGSATAEILQAAFALSRRRSDALSEDRPYIRSPIDVFMLIQADYRGQKQEITKAILKDTRNRVLKIETVFVGTLNFSVLHPREIFQVALRHNAASIILTHNHPSGEADPSPEDIQATQQIAEAGKLIDIPLLDHVIIGDGCYTFLKEKKLL